MGNPGLYNYLRGLVCGLSGQNVITWSASNDVWVNSDAENKVLSCKKKIFKKAKSRQSVKLRRMPNSFDILTKDYHKLEGKPVSWAVPDTATNILLFSTDTNGQC